ncbi:MAG TPA: glycosyltransferase family 2 protein [Vicinamibacterales bacterium]
MSVVMAVYNRSNILRFVLDSLRAQTRTDWELIAVGDACTDDSGEVVASYGDPRFHWINLPRNHGEQSGPNNEGLQRARGRYIAFLNHDDLWLPNHLEVLVSAIEETGADLVFSLVALVQPEGPSILGGAGETGRYEPQMSVPASTWLLRRELIDRVGGWRSYRDCLLPPSQDWLRRAWKAGADLRAVSSLGVLAIQSGGRARSYAERQDDEHARLAARLARDSRFVERELTAMAVRHAAVDPIYGSSTAIRPYVVRALKNAGRAVLRLAGLHSDEVRMRLMGRRGRYIDKLRRTRGLPELPRRRAHRPSLDLQQSEE